MGQIKFLKKVMISKKLSLSLNALKLVEKNRNMRDKYALRTVIQLYGYPLGQLPLGTVIPRDRYAPRTLTNIGPLYSEDQMPPPPGMVSS